MLDLIASVYGKNNVNNRQRISKPNYTSKVKEVTFSCVREFLDEPINLLLYKMHFQLIARIDFSCLLPTSFF